TAPLCPAQRSPMLGCGREHLLSQRVGRHIGHNLELCAVFQNLCQPPMRERGEPFADQLVDLALDFSARAARALADDPKQALRHLEPVRALRVEIQRSDTLFGRSDADEIACEHELSTWLIK